MSFFDAVIDTHRIRDKWVLYLVLRSNHIPAACFATRPGGEIEDGRGVGREGGRKRGRAEEVRRGGGSEAGNDGGREGVGKRGRAEEGRVGPSLLY